VGWWRRRKRRGEGEERGLEDEADWVDGEVSERFLASLAHRAPNNVGMTYRVWIVLHGVSKRWVEE
jgi:hypothetical protein